MAISNNCSQVESSSNTSYTESLWKNLTATHWYVIELTYCIMPCFGCLTTILFIMQRKQMTQTSKCIHLRLSDDIIPSYACGQSKLQQNKHGPVGECAEYFFTSSGGEGNGED